MNNSFFAYLQLVELLGFFSGYCLLYLLIHIYAGKPERRGGFKKRLVALLPYAYGMTGVLYLALQLKNLFHDYSIAHIATWMEKPWLLSWAFLSLLFWIPVIAKKPVLSLLHSLVFVVIMVYDILVNYNTGYEILQNNLHLFTYSLLVNAITIAIVVSISYLLSRYKLRLRGHKN